MVLFPHLTYAVTVWGGGCSKAKPYKAAVFAKLILRNMSIKINLFRLLIFMIDINFSIYHKYTFILQLFNYISTTFVIIVNIFITE